MSGASERCSDVRPATEFDFLTCTPGDQWVCVAALHQSVWESSSGSSRPSQDGLSEAAPDLLLYTSCHVLNRFDLCGLRRTPMLRSLKTKSGRLSLKMWVLNDRVLLIAITGFYSFFPTQQVEVTVFVGLLRNMQIVINGHCWWHFQSKRLFPSHILLSQLYILYMCRFCHHVVRLCNYTLLCVFPTFTWFP